jgi:hypothetical protein
VAKEASFMLTVSKLLRDEIVWNKELVVIEVDNVRSEMKRLEFHYDAIDNDYEVSWIEALYDEKSKTIYLLIHCVKN